MIDKSFDEGRKGVFGFGWFLGGWVALRTNCHGGKSFLRGLGRLIA